MVDDIFRTYILEGREYYETIPRYASPDVREGMPKIKDFPFTESLFNFLYLDVREVEQRVRRTLDILQSDNPERALYAQSELGELPRLHFYFQPLVLYWMPRLSRDLITDADKEALAALPEQIARVQAQLEELFRMVFDLDASKEPIPVKLSHYYSDCWFNGGDEPYPFRALATTWELVLQYEFIEVLHPGSIFDLVDFHVRACLRREIPFRVCKNCHRWFALTGHQGLEYCSRLVDGKGRTCKDVGAAKVWTQKAEDDPYFTAYRKEYKKRFARIKAGKLTQEEFFRWSEEVRRQRENWNAMPLEEFKMWLKKS